MHVCKTHGRTGRKKLGGRKEICPTFSDCVRVVKKIFGRSDYQKFLLDNISHKIDRNSHKIDRICPIYFYNKPILPDCEANIARLALFAQETGGGGGGGAAAPSAPPPGTPMVRHISSNVLDVAVILFVSFINCSTSYMSNISFTFCLLDDSLVDISQHSDHQTNSIPNFWHQKIRSFVQIL